MTNNVTNFLIIIEFVFGYKKENFLVDFMKEDMGLKIINYPFLIYMDFTFIDSLNRGMRSSPGLQLAK